MVRRTRPQGCNCTRGSRGSGFALNARPGTTGNNHPSTVFPLLITVTLRAFTLASNEMTLPSFQSSIVTVSPGNTGEENRADVLLEGGRIVVGIGLQHAAAGDAVGAHAVQDRPRKAGLLGKLRIGVQRVAVAAQAVDQRLVRPRGDCAGARATSSPTAIAHRPRVPASATPRIRTTRPAASASTPAWAIWTISAGSLPDVQVGGGAHLLTGTGTERTAIRLRNVNQAWLGYSDSPRPATRARPTRTRRRRRSAYEDEKSSSRLAGGDRADRWYHSAIATTIRRSSAQTTARRRPTIRRAMSNGRPGSRAPHARVKRPIGSRSLRPRLVLLRFSAMRGRRPMSMPSTTAGADLGRDHHRSMIAQAYSARLVLVRPTATLLALDAHASRCR